MKREAALPSVAISGVAPASVVFELQRMGREWFTVERVPSPQHAMPSALALLRYVCNDAAEASGALTSAVPVLDIACSGNSALEMMRRRDVERFDVAEPLQRLALLARLATLRSGQRAASSGQRAAGSGQRAAGSGQQAAGSRQQGTRLHDM